MRIGIDLHGVLDKYPEKFKPMLKMFEKMDIEVCVVSGPPEDKVEIELEKSGLRATLIRAVEVATEKSRSFK